MRKVAAAFFSTFPHLPLFYPFPPLSHPGNNVSAEGLDFPELGVCICDCNPNAPLWGLSLSYFWMLCLDLILLGPYKASSVGLSDSPPPIPHPPLSAHPKGFLCSEKLVGVGAEGAMVAAVI